MRQENKSQLFLTAEGKAFRVSQVCRTQFYCLITLFFSVFFLILFLYLFFYLGCAGSSLLRKLLVASLVTEHGL